MNKKAIIFDFDGTIADSLMSIVKIFNVHAHSFGLPEVSEEQVEALRTMTYWQIVRKYNIPLLKIPFIITKVRNDLYSSMDKTVLFPGIKKVMKALKSKGYIVGILTSNSKENVEQFLKSHELIHFDFIYSETNLFGKSRALKNLLSKYKLKPKEMIYVGDEVRDIEACKQIPVDIISVTYGFNKKETLLKHSPTYIVDKPEEILGILNRK